MGFRMIVCCSKSDVTILTPARVLILEKRKSLSKDLEQKYSSISTSTAEMLKVLPNWLQMSKPLQQMVLVLLVSSCVQLQMLHMVKHSNS